MAAKIQKLMALFGALFYYDGKGSDPMARAWLAARGLLHHKTSKASP
jgi:hypothetical protein